MNLKQPIARTLICLGLTLPTGYAHAVEFADYDFRRYSQTVTDCDRHAAHGRDPGSVGEPVTSATMDKKAAIAACHKAVQKDPDNPRLNYQLGRAYGYSNRGDEAMPYRLKAVEADYPQSLFVIGYLYFTGRTIEKNTCKAMELWQRGAHYRRLAALVALPRHYMRGDFADCDIAISNDDLKQYLAEARRHTTDFYATMLIEDLEAEVDRRSSD